MLTSQATPEMIVEWKKIFETHRGKMHPNRKSGVEVDAYFREKYAYRQFDNEDFRKVIESNIVDNEFSRGKLPKGGSPDIRCYSVDDVLVGIDLASGEFHLESEEIEKAVPIYDDLFRFRGLDEADLQNFFLVADYVKLTEGENRWNTSK